MCWRMVRAPAWRIRLWSPSRTDLPSVQSRRCAISFPTWSRALSDRTRPNLPRWTVRAVVAQASHMLPRLDLIAGGKSFGGRMTSQAQAESPLPGVRGLAFLGFPLHAAGRPSEERAKHLFEVEIPMLFLQGTRETCI
jgi:uncharacterized protein